MPLRALDFESSQKVIPENPCPKNQQVTPIWRPQSPLACRLNLPKTFPGKPVCLGAIVHTDTGFRSSLSPTHSLPLDRIGLSSLRGSVPLPQRGAR